LHRRITGAHFSQYGFGRNAAVHDPNAPRTAVLVLDFIKECP
jgi:hypothetical protein